MNEFEDKFEEDLEKQNNSAIIKIANYLLTRDDITDNLKKGNKSLGGMWQYILQEMSNKYIKKNGIKNGGIGCNDEEVYALAVHYYDEDDIKIQSKANENVKVQVATTEDNKKVSKPAKKNKAPEGQLTLFDAIGD